MRILVLQLARFGDIFQTWPTIKALRRQNPAAEVHILVRERFASAMVGLEGVHVHVLPTAQILGPVLASGDTDAALAQMQQVMASLRLTPFSQIINLSFSPLSSYLTEALAEETTKISGYTRHSDGYLAIPDETSAYFYAQVGVGRFNRYHVTELFAAVAGVELAVSDFSMERPIHTARQGVVVHLGASQQSKAYPPEMWIDVLCQLLKQAPDLRITLIGSLEDRALAATVCRQVNNSMLKNLVGETQLQELFEVIGQSRLLIGADSAPVHIASLVQTPVLNLSCAQVNFWETGPCSADSRVLYADDLSEISPSCVAEETAWILAEQPLTQAIAHRMKTLVPYSVHQQFNDEFEWQLIQALYVSGDYPQLQTSADQLAIRRLHELTEMALEVMAQWHVKDARARHTQTLDQVDTLILQVGHCAPALQPLLEWFQTQRLRLGPATPEQTLEKTQQIFNEFSLITSIYLPAENQAELLQTAINLCLECSVELREYNFAKIESHFNTLVSSIHQLASSSTNVQPESSWTKVLEGFKHNMEQQDYIALADCLEWELAPSLEERVRTG